MSYWTKVRVKYSGDKSVTGEELAAAAKAHLQRWVEWCAIDDVGECLDELFRDGVGDFCDLRCPELSRLFKAVSRKFPLLTVVVSGRGEERGDTWTREFLGGKVVGKRGPAKKR